jgi:hypothetical protein
VNVICDITSNKNIDWKPCTIMKESLKGLQEVVIFETEITYILTNLFHLPIIPFNLYNSPQLASLCYHGFELTNLMKNIWHYICVMINYLHIFLTDFLLLTFVENGILIS